MKNKKILYVDMDNVLVDFKTGIERISEEDKKLYEGRYDDVPGIFSLMDPMKDAIESYNKLSSHYYLLLATRRTRARTVNQTTKTKERRQNQRLFIR